MTGTVSNLKALEIWTAQTLCDVGILLSFVSFLLYIARPYFERVLSRITLRVAADLWWIAYTVMRDGSLFLAALLGVWHLNLDLMADIKIGLPFVPAATVMLVAALLHKIFFDTEDNGVARRLHFLLVTIAATLNLVGYVFVMESPGSEYATSSSPFWSVLHSWRSNLNPQLSLVTFYVSFFAFLLLGLIGVIASIRRNKNPHVRA